MKRIISVLLTLCLLLGSIPLTLAEELPAATEPTAVQSDAPQEAATTEPSAQSETTDEPAAAPATDAPTSEPAAAPATDEPTNEPTDAPATDEPTNEPSDAPATDEPTSEPADAPATDEPTSEPTDAPATDEPTNAPSDVPATDEPTAEPTDDAAAKDVLPASAVVSPTGLTSSLSSYRSVNLSWLAVSGANGYRIYRCQGQDGTYTQIGQVNSGATTTYVDSLTASYCGTTFYYRVTAYVGTDESARSGYTKCTLHTFTPQNVSATALSHSSVRIAWTAVDGANGYEVSYRTDTNPQFQVLTGNVATVYFDHTALTPGVTYTYRVRSFYNASYTDSYSDYSAYATVAPSLSQVTNFKAVSADYNEVALTWTAVTGASGYVLERTDGQSTKSVGSTTTVSYTDTSTATNPFYAGTQYTYTIRPYLTINGVNYEGPAVTADCTPVPAAPAGVTVKDGSVSGTSIVAWTAKVANDGYYIYRSTAVNGTFTRIGTVNNTSASFTDDTGLIPGVTYYYQVQAFMKVANLTVDGAVCAAVGYLAAPPTPTGVFAVGVTSSRIRISWADYDWSRVPTAHGYEVYYSYDNVNFRLLGNTTGTTMLHKRLTAGRTVYYRVRSYCETPTGVRKFGAYSGTDVYGVYPNAYPSAGAPTRITVKQSSNTKTRVSWPKVAGATGYVVYASTSPTAGFTQVARTTKTKVDVKNLKLGYTYYIYVKSYVTYNKTNYESNTQSPSKSLKLVPKGVANFKAKAKGATGATLTWSAIPNVTGFYLTYTNKYGAYDVKLGNVSSYTVSDAHITGVSTTYRLTPYVIDETGAELLSTSTAAASALSRLGKPSALKLSTENENIRLTWKGVSGATGYVVYRKIGGHGGYEMIAQTDTTTFVDDEQTVYPGAKVYYRVRAFVEVDGSKRLGKNSASRSILTRCGKVTGLVATPYYNRVSLDWNATTGAQGYYVYRSDSPNGEFTRIATTAKTNYNDKALIVGVTYYYKVSAYNTIDGALETGVSSDEVSGRAAPNAASGLTFTKGVGSTTLAWTAVTGATGYYVERSDDNVTFTRIGTISANTILLNGYDTTKTYYYRVQPYIASTAGFITGGYSNVVTVTP